MAETGTVWMDLLLHESSLRLPSTAEPRLPSPHCSSRSTMQIAEEAPKTAFVNVVSSLPLLPMLAIDVDSTA
ncbi:unnamed protein product [Rodentolepis nana]|uniref:Uncharacterized protein n=1 Tax=Rodentolepis nana TaxID=102285 RepID=A0A0R3TPF2_RODNA|nr:unnamed protein product [Rodentolepis nana]